MKASALMGGGVAVLRIRHIGPEALGEIFIPRAPLPPESGLQPAPSQAQSPTLGRPPPFVLVSAFSLQPFPISAFCFPNFCFSVPSLNPQPSTLNQFPTVFICGQRNPKNLGTNYPEKSDVSVTGLTALMKRKL